MFNGRSAADAECQQIDQTYKLVSKQADEFDDWMSVHGRRCSRSSIDCQAGL